MEFEIAANPSVDALDKVPEHFRPLYKQGEGGKYVLDESLKPVAGAIDGLNKANKTIRKTFDDFKKNTPDVRPWKNLATVLELDPDDATPELVQSAIEDLRTKAAGGDKSAKINLEKLKKDMEKATAAAINAKEAELGVMRGSLQKYLVDNAAVTSIAALKGVPELLLPHIRSATKVIQDGADFVVRVVDAQGDPRGDGKGGFMTVADLVKEMKASPTFGRAFESEAPAGGGARPASRGGPAPVRQPGTGAERSATQKIADGLRAGR